MAETESRRPNGRRGLSRRRRLHRGRCRSRCRSPALSFLLVVVGRNRRRRGRRRRRRRHGRRRGRDGVLAAAVAVAGHGEADQEDGEEPEDEAGEGHRPPGPASRRCETGIASSRGSRSGRSWHSRRHRRGVAEQRQHSSPVAEPIAARRRAATAAADGRSAGSIAVMAATVVARPAGSASGMSGPWWSRATAAAMPAPSKARRPVAASSTTRPRL